ncbi:MAG: competence/damage-inducible protein A [Ruminococcus sp.]|jgi:nicotinamide-nucleotide amidase
MVAELITVGTEILMGNIVNTNAAYLSEMCARLGLTLYYETTVGDNEKRMYETICTALERSDIVILSGGLGPTQDDITKDTAAKAMNLPLVEDEHTRRRIQEYFETLRGKNVTITENNWRQALVPQGAIVLDNENGTAPGLIMEKDEKTVILLPGPPSELKPMFERQVFPYLEKKQPEVLCSRMVKICGIGESMVETMIEDLISAQSNPTIAPYAKIGEVHLRVTASAFNDEAAERLIKPVVKELKKRFGKHIYTTDEKVTLEESLVKMMKKRKLTLTCAESCTGGAISARIVNVPGASDVLKQGLVTYSNKAKRRYLNVKKETLKSVGAVSRETAFEMAKGGCVQTGSDACVAVTGIAGPGGGTDTKPVGLVYIGCCVNGHITVKEYHFTGNRAKIREQSVMSALTLLRSSILKYS